MIHPALEICCPDDLVKGRDRGRLNGFRINNLFFLLKIQGENKNNRKPHHGMNEYMNE